MTSKTKNPQRRVLNLAERVKVAGGTLGSGFVKPPRTTGGAAVDGNISAI